MVGSLLRSGPCNFRYAFRRMIDSKTINEKKCDASKWNMHSFEKKNRRENATLPLAIWMVLSGSVSRADTTLNFLIPSSMIRYVYRYSYTPLPQPCISKQLLTLNKSLEHVHRGEILDAYRVSYKIKTLYKFLT